LSQVYVGNGSGGGGGGTVNSVEGVSPILVNGVSGTPETGNVVVSIAENAFIQTITGDVNGAEGPDAVGNFNFHVFNATIQFEGGVNEQLLDFGNNSYSSGSLILGTKPSNLTGQRNTGLGINVFNVLTSGNDNTSIGYQTSSALTSGSDNTALGSSSLRFNVSGVSNTAIGYDTLYTDLGSYNIAVGSSSGTNYVASESSNIVIGNLGTASESNVIRIGTQGTGNGQQNKNFQAGITGVTVAASAPVAVDTNGQLSSLGFGTSTQVLTSNGPGVSPTWQAAGGGGITEYFSVNLTSPQNNVTGDGTQYQIPFNSQLTSTPNANYNTSTGVYTAPSTGIYSFSKTLTVNPNASGATQIISYWNGSAFNIRSAQEEFAANIGGFILSDTITIPMNAGDTMSCAVLASGGTKTATVYGQTPTGGATTSLFSGFKVA